MPRPKIRRANNGGCSNNNDHRRGNNRFDKGWRGGFFRGRGRNFRDNNRFDNNSNRPHYGPDLEPNFHENKDNENQEPFNSELDQHYQKRINEERIFPKFKDDAPNRFMPRNRSNYDNSEIPLGYVDYQSNINNNHKTFDYKNDPQAINKEPPIEIHNESNNQEVQKESNQDQRNATETSSNVFLNMKKEVSIPVNKPIQKSVTSASSDSSSDSNDSSTEKSKKVAKKNKKLSKKEDEKKFLLPMPKIKREPGLKKSEKDSSSSDSSSSSSSSSSESEDSSSAKEKTKKKLKKKNSEEEVICLGKLEKFENLVDDEETSSNQLNTNESISCILCEKTDHTSFYCQMICKNCGAQYHNLKNCPKPANLSMMLQNFLEFCLNQCTIYNPDQRFSFRNGSVQTELLPAFVPSSTRNLNENNSFSTPNEYGGSIKVKRRHLKSQSEHVNSNKPNAGFKNKVYSDSEHENLSDSSSSQGTSSTKHKRKRQKLQSTTPINTPTYPGGMGFSSPFAFNPMMAAAFSQMMGFNPAAAMNFGANANKEK